MTEQRATLTRQFYEWETRLRGWQKASYAVQLEPPFVPFFGHYLPDSPIIDDGRKPSFFQSLFKRQANMAVQSVPIEEQTQPYLCTEGRPLTIFSIAIPKNGRAHGDHVEQLLTMLLYRNSPVSFELIGTAEEIAIQLVCRDTDAGYIYTQVKAYFPECGVQETYTDHIEEWLHAELCLYTIDFGLAEECMRPLAQLTGDREPLVPLFGILDQLRSNECVIVQTVFSGLCNPWAEQMLNAVCDNDGKGSFFYDEPDMVRLAHEKVSRPLCAATVRAMAFAETMQEACTLLDHAATALMHGAKSAANELLMLPDASYTVHERIADMLMRTSHRTGMLLNARELATLAHLPLIPLRKASLQRNTKGVPHALLGHDYNIGLNVHQGVESLVSLSTEQRLRHMHAIGVSGTGKSTFLHSLMMEDTRLGNGFMCLDPHGDLIDMLLDTIPEERVKDVVLIDPSDGEYPIGFNILSAHSELEKELLASDLVALFRRFSSSWGDQMNSVFANAILAFLYNSKGGTLSDLRRFLIETAFRTTILATVTDPDIRYYWLHEYPLLKSSSIGSILTRLDTFLRPRTIRNMVCQKESLDFAHLMDSQKIILVKLSQGLLGAENSFLLGAFIVSKLQQIAMSRQAQAKETRVPFYCYIDEFHHFVTPSMSEILTGARKYGLGLVLAHQHMQQVHDTAIAESVLSAGTRVCFRLNDTDAKRLQEGFASFAAADLQNLSVGDSIVRVNTSTNDCTLSTIPYERHEDSNREEIIGQSRSTYSSGIPQPAQEAPVEAKPAPVTTAPTDEPSPAVFEQTPKTHIVTPEPKDDQPTAMREHRYLQSFIKKLAEGNGYRAQLEARTPDGGGQVDVLLEKDGWRIAIEISVSTSATWELHNVEKCLAAGYEQVAVCSTNQSKCNQIQTLMHAKLSEAQRSRVRVVHPDQVQSLFAAAAQPPQASETIMKGYRVKVAYGQSPLQTDELIQRMLSKLP